MFESHTSHFVVYQRETVSSALKSLQRFDLENASVSNRFWAGKSGIKTAVSIVSEPLLMGKD
jgi:hypothetical protein